MLGAFGACEPYLSLDEALEGKSCDAQGRCAAGFVCNDANLCVSPASVQMASGSALPGAGGEGGAASATPPGAAGDAGAAPGGAGAGSVEPMPGGAGGMPGSAGSAGLPDDGSGDGSVGSGAEPGSPDAGCANPVQLFRDLDGDGFGGEPVAEPGCPGGGLVAVGGDCLDVAPSEQPLAFFVNPGQPNFFREGYPSSTSPSGVSFDYDCDGEESADPALAAGVQVPDCSQALVCSTTIFGYRSTDRTGPGENPVCGSINFVYCLPVADGSCSATEVVRSRNDAFPCK